MARATSTSIPKDSRETAGALPAPGAAGGATGPSAFERPSRRSRKTRSALIEAARELLEEQGVPALTVKAVTDRADVGHGTFYHHFPSTEAVLAAGIEQSMREFAEAIGREYSDAEDKAWVFVASLSSTFRMLVAHPALGWMLERPQVLAAALRDACGPFAQRDVAAMISAGDVKAEVSARYWEWLIVGALVDATAHPADQRRIEARLVTIILRILGLEDRRIARLVGGLGEQPRIARKGARSRP